MKSGTIVWLIVVSFLTACVSIPKETITLSQTLGSDLEILHNAHRSMVEIHFNKIKDDINAFVDDVYAPYVVHFVLNSELKNYKDGKPSLLGSIETVGKVEGKVESQNALKEISDFLDAARRQIETKRNELISPIAKQESEVLSKVNQSYENAIYANSTITGYLQSVRKVRETQQQALSMIGLSRADTLITNTLVKVSDYVEAAVKIGKTIDIYSDDAFVQLEAVSNKLKNITFKK